MAEPTTRPVLKRKVLAKTGPRTTLAAPPAKQTQPQALCISSQAARAAVRVPSGSGWPMHLRCRSCALSGCRRPSTTTDKPKTSWGSLKWPAFLCMKMKMKPSNCRATPADCSMRCPANQAGTPAGVHLLCLMFLAQSTPKGNKHPHERHMQTTCAINKPPTGMVYLISGVTQVVALPARHTLSQPVLWKQVLKVAPRRYPSPLCLPIAVTANDL
mmetsp:Transcript_18771/g.59020  ORF Transcript_18771/g.59020 Transcript_18771/m.59020 type:complete len:215 (+) Transcript_18771:131-775(+)